MTVGTDIRKVLVLGSGPAVFGQSGEHDHSASEAIRALVLAGVEVVVLESNPAAVASDPGLAQRTYLEPLTLQTAQWLLEHERPDALVATVGGRLALNLAGELLSCGALERHLVQLLGLTGRALLAAEDRLQFSALVEGLGLKTPPYGVARSEEQARALAEQLGYPAVLRPVQPQPWGHTQVLHDEADLEEHLRGPLAPTAQHPALVARFLKNAVQADVELLRDREGNLFVAGVLEHIEEAGVHPGDAACALPPYSLSPEVVERMKDQAGALAEALELVGHLNVRFALQGKSLYLLELAPRASRNVPFVSRATGLPLARHAVRCLLGESLPAQGLGREAEPRFVAVREAVFRFASVRDPEVLLGPRMRSTGMVIGLAKDHATAFAKAQLAAGGKFPAKEVAIFISVKDEDKPAVVDLARRLRAMGHPILATAGTCRYLADKRIPSLQVNKVFEGGQTAVELILEGRIGMVINTTSGRQSVADSRAVGRAALGRGVSWFTTAQAARMAVEAMEAMARGPLQYRPLQDP